MTQALVAMAAGLLGCAVLGCLLVLIVRLEERK